MRVFVVFLGSAWTKYTSKVSHPWAFKVLFKIIPSPSKEERICYKGDKLTLVYKIYFKNIVFIASSPP